jgi:hypothetical protein
MIETLNTGEVYYYTSSSDMTGARITSDKPIAFFAVNQVVQIPDNVGTQDHLFQQLAPVNTWGKNFFVPVSHLTKDRVRIVASKDNTTITPTGGTVITGSLTLNAGQWVELEVYLAENGCYIHATEPVGICTYLTGKNHNVLGVSDPAQAWLPAIEQTAPNALIAPFVPTGNTNLTDHYAIVVTPTLTKENTEVSIGGAASVPLDVTMLLDGIWHNNSDADMSFGIMPLDDPDASYFFTNDAKLIVLCYGVGNMESYYYLGSSSMRDLTAAFSANGVGCEDMTADYLFCVNNIKFTTNIDNIAEIKELNWYMMKTSGNTPDLNYVPITDIDEDPPLEWTRHFKAGNYMIKMEVIYNDDTELICEGELCIGVWIKPIPISPAGGTVSPAVDCYKVGGHIELRVH